MKEKIIKVLKVILPISIGVYLTWYFISNSTESEKEHFISAFTGANYLWILLALVIAFLSHFSRAYRWKYLLQTLDIKPNLKDEFAKLHSAIHQFDSFINNKK